MRVALTSPFLYGGTNGDIWFFNQAELEGPGLLILNFHRDKASLDILWLREESENRPRFRRSCRRDRRRPRSHPRTIRQDRGPSGRGSYSIRQGKSGRNHLAETRSEDEAEGDV